MDNPEDHGYNDTVKRLRRLLDGASRKCQWQQRIIAGLRSQQLLAVVQEIEATEGRKSLVAVVDSDDNIIYASERLSKVLGYESSGLVGKDYHDFLEDPKDSLALYGEATEGFLALKAREGKQVLVRVGRRPYQFKETLRKNGRARDVTIYAGAKVTFSRISRRKRGEVREALLKQREAKTRAQIDNIKKDIERLLGEMDS